MTKRSTEQIAARASDTVRGGGKRDRANARAYREAAIREYCEQHDIALPTTAADARRIYDLRMTESIESIKAHCAAINKQRRET